MKKITYICTIAGLLFITSCNKEVMPQQSDEKQPVAASDIRICGSYAKFDSQKTMLESDGQSIRWGNQGDSTEYILLTYQFTSTVPGSGRDSCYHVMASDSLGHSTDHKTAYFKLMPLYLSDIRKIKPGHKFNALYPYCATGGNASFYPDSTQNSQITFPSVQRAVASGLPLNLDPYSKIATHGASANVMTARATMSADSTISLAFKNVGALLKFTLRGDDDVIADLDSIKINSVGATLAGRPKGGVGDDGVYTLQGSFKNRKPDVFLVKPEGGWAADSTYYACVLPSEVGKTAKLSFTFIFNDGKTFTRSNPQANAIVRNQIYNLDTISVVKQILPTHQYQMYFSGTVTDQGPVTGMYSLVDGTASSSNNYFAISKEYTSGTWNDQPKFSTTKDSEKSKINYSCFNIYSRSYYRLPPGTYKKSMKESGMDSLKVNSGYKIVRKSSQNHSCYVEFTTSSDVKSTVTLYHVRRHEEYTEAKLCFVGYDNNNEMKDSVSFPSPWANWAVITRPLMKGLKYTLKNVSPDDDENAEVSLLSLTVQESN